MNFEGYGFGLPSYNFYYELAGTWVMKVLGALPAVVAITMIGDMLGRLMNGRGAR